MEFRRPITAVGTGETPVVVSLASSVLEPSAVEPSAVEPSAVEPSAVEPNAAQPVEPTIASQPTVEASVAPVVSDLWAPRDFPEPAIEVEVAEPATDTWSPQMPAQVPARSPAASAGAWRRPYAPTVAVPVVSTAPVLKIDDADPERAEREREERSPRRRSFLPPILLDRDDRSARQGELTLAVILLLIAATITLSYLMRRPSSSGDGVTLAAPASSLIQLA